MLENVVAFKLNYEDRAVRLPKNNLLKKRILCGQRQEALACYAQIWRVPSERKSVINFRTSRTRTSMNSPPAAVSNWTKFREVYLSVWSNGDTCCFAINYFNQLRPSRARQVPFGTAQICIVDADGALYHLRQAAPKPIDLNWKPRSYKRFRKWRCMSYQKLRPQYIVLLNIFKLFRRFTLS